MDWLLIIASDSKLFWALQVALFGFFVLSFFGNVAAKKRSGKGGVTLSIKRGNESMALFYGSYIALSGLLVALCLSVEEVENYKVFWVLVDTLASAYICIFNPWSRNILLGWAHYLRQIEKR